MNKITGDEEGAVIAFIAGIANMSLKPPSGVPVGQWQAKRLREIRNAANHVLHNQFDELALAVASMLGDGKLLYTGDGVSLAEQRRH